MNRKEIDLIETLVISVINLFQLNDLEEFPEDEIAHEEKEIEEIKKKLEEC